MNKLMFTTSDKIAPLFLRIFLGLVLFPHGAQKLLGWFGGFGFGETMHYFTDTVGLPWYVGFLVIIIEFFGSLALLIGFAVRIWSVAIAVVMTGVILTHFSNYFFMNWFGVQKTEGMEFFLLAIGMAISLIYSGAGSWSVDAILQKNKKVKRSAASRLSPAHSL